MCESYFKNILYTKTKLINLINNSHTSNSTHEYTIRIIQLITLCTNYYYISGNSEKFELKKVSWMCSQMTVLQYIDCDNAIAKIPAQKYWSVLAYRTSIVQNFLEPHSPPENALREACADARSMLGRLSKPHEAILGYIYASGPSSDV